MEKPQKIGGIRTDNVFFLFCILIVTNYFTEGRTGFIPVILRNLKPIATCDFPGMSGPPCPSPPSPSGSTHETHLLLSQTANYFNQLAIISVLLENFSFLLLQSKELWMYLALRFLLFFVNIFSPKIIYFKYHLECFKIV